MNGDRQVIQAMRACQLLYIEWGIRTCMCRSRDLFQRTFLLS